MYKVNKKDISIKDMSFEKVLNYSIKTILILFKEFKIHKIN